MVQLKTGCYSNEQCDFFGGRLIKACDCDVWMKTAVIGFNSIRNH